jgi:formate dehydrogenase subunit gamma
MKTNLRRFSTARIVEHGIQIVTFGVLVVTGLSQRFYTLDISLWFILHAGGIDNVRLIHRFAGLVFSLATTVHVAVAVAGILFRRWQPSMVITKNDFRNAVHNIRYYLGLENHPAPSGRYSYTQKFEYWGILTGGFLMIATGIILWKPLFITRFMTGEIIPAAKALHSNEALVVFLIIAVWHIYNAIFSPEVFPLNASIFTGSIPRQRMVREHILELSRLEGRSPEELRNSSMEEDAEAFQEHGRIPGQARGH